MSSPTDTIYPGDRIRVTEAYGEKFPAEAQYVGCEGVYNGIGPGDWSEYSDVLLDCDHALGKGNSYFLPDEIERVV